MDFKQLFILLFIFSLFLASCEKKEEPVLSRPKITFVINVHDWYYIDQSAATVDRLLTLFEKYNVKAEFYMTESVFRKYEEEHPEVLQRLLADNMTISYHLRAPHPVPFLSNYSEALQELSYDQLVAALMNYETHALDLTTGDYDSSKEGGYAYITKKIGYAPPVAGLNAKSEVLRKAELEVLHKLGLQMYVRRHLGDSLEMTSLGILSRPSPFGLQDANKIFSWFYAGSSQIAERTVDPYRETINPSLVFQNASGYGVVLVHDDDFFASHAGWSQVYWKNLDNPKQKKAPYTLTSSDGNITFYSEEERARMWENYETLVAYAVSHFDVVTSRDIIAAYHAR